MTENWPMPLDLSFDKCNSYTNKRIKFCYDLAFTQSSVWKRQSEFSLNNNKKMEHAHTTTPPQFLLFDLGNVRSLTDVL